MKSSYNVGLPNRLFTTLLWMLLLTSNIQAASSAKTVGIDLGTTYSCVAVYRDGHVEIIPNEQGNRITPSIVAFQNAVRLIGDAAKNQMASNPQNTIFDAKRILGRHFSDKSVQHDMKMWPFKVVNQNNKPMFQVEWKGETKLFAPEEISAMVLSKMKQVASTYLNANVTDAVVTVPAYFNDAQRQATKDAGKIAGLNVIRTINEPTAASLAYGLKTGSDKEMNVIVFDLGGGTFDVSLLTLDDEVFEVVATSGDAHLGGQDFDARVMKYFIKTFKQKHGVDLAKNERALSKLRREVEKAKRSLSSMTQVRIEIESIADGIDFAETLSRARFEELNSDLFRKTLKPLQRVLSDAKMKKADIDEIVLVGGSTRIPKIQQLVRDFFNGKTPNRGVNPDEAVAHGAAIQAAIMTGELDKGVIIDVVSLSVGIKTVGDVMTKIVERNTNIPVVKKQTFTTYQDSQTAVSIEVYQGERAKTKDNILLGKFELSGIPPAPRGQPQIEVTFDIDANGILHVSAEELQGGNKESIAITKDRQGQLSEEDIQAMVRDAQENEEADRRILETVETKNKLEGKMFWLKNQLAGENGGEEDGQSQLLTDNLSEEDRETLDEVVQETQRWLEEYAHTADLETMEQKLTEFEKVTEPILKDVFGNENREPPKYEDDEDDHDDLFDDSHLEL